jgi:hypothetical protein
MTYQCLQCKAAHHSPTTCTCGGRLFVISAAVVEVEEHDIPVNLDVETIHEIQEGEYEIDVQKLFDNRPLIVKTADGKYRINLK